MDVELEIGLEVQANFIEGDTSLFGSPQRYFPGDDENFVDPEECPCYGSAFAKETVGGAYFGNCLKDFWLEGEDGDINTFEPGFPIWLL